MSEQEIQGRFFDDFSIGEKIITQGRTITEADIVNFAGLSGDYNRIHTDAAFAAGHQFGQRVAHGMLVHSVATGLAVQTGFIKDTVIAFRDLSCKFSLPIFIGDTIHVELEIVELKPLRRLGGGNVGLKITVLNQDGKAVQRGTWNMLVKGRE